MVSDKLVSYSKLNRLTKALDNRLQLSKAELEELIAEVRDMFGGKSICYITQAEYDMLTEDEKNDETKTYFITDASDSHDHGDIYYTEAEIDEKIEIINESINEAQAEIDLLNANKADKSELEALGASLNPGITTINVNNGQLQLTDDKYQKVDNLVNGVELLFPTVDKFTEIHLYFDIEENMDLTFPDCKWRVEPNLEEGYSYEIIMVYNTVHWLVTVITYS